MRSIETAAPDTTTKAKVAGPRRKGCVWSVEREQWECRRCGEAALEGQTECPTLMGYELLEVVAYGNTVGFARGLAMTCEQRMGRSPVWVTPEDRQRRIEWLRRKAKKLVNHPAIPPYLADYIRPLLKGSKRGKQVIRFYRILRDTVRHAAVTRAPLPPRPRSGLLDRARW